MQADMVVYNFELRCHSIANDSKESFFFFFRSKIPRRQINLTFVLWIRYYIDSKPEKNIEQPPKQYFNKKLSNSIKFKIPWQFSKIDLTENAYVKKSAKFFLHGTKLFCCFDFSLVLIITTPPFVAKLFSREWLSNFYLHKLCIYTSFRVFWLNDFPEDISQCKHLTPSPIAAPPYSGNNDLNNLKLRFLNM